MHARDNTTRCYAPKRLQQPDAGDCNWLVLQLTVCLGRHPIKPHPPEEMHAPPNLVKKYSALVKWYSSPAENIRLQGWDDMDCRSKARQNQKAKMAYDVCSIRSNAHGIVSTFDLEPPALASFCAMESTNVSMRGGTAKATSCTGTIKKLLRTYRKLTCAR